LLHPRGVLRLAHAPLGAPPGRDAAQVAARLPRTQGEFVLPERRGPRPLLGQPRPERRFDPRARRMIRQRSGQTVGHDGHSGRGDATEAAADGLRVVVQVLRDRADGPAGGG